MVYLPPRVAPCRCVSCSEGNCHVYLTGLAAQVEVVKLECVKKLLRLAGRICDCGIVWKNRPLIAAVELKGGKNLPVGRAVAQIQQGLHAMESVLSGETVEDFLPILLFGGRDPTASLVGVRVNFRGSQRRIIARPCGARLSNVVRDALGRRPTVRRRRR